VRTKTTVVTSFGRRQAEAYAFAFVETFRKYWPSCAELVIYHEGEGSDQWGGRNLIEIKSCASFLERHESENGTNADGEYNFRTDAFKFCRKVFAQADAATRLGAGRMIWLDADIVTRRPVPEELLQYLVDDRDTITYLGRQKPTSECGFVGYNLDRSNVREFLRVFAKDYSTDRVFSRTEQHDSYVFDRLREEMGIQGRSLARWPQSKVFQDSVLGIFMSHFKGQGKRQKLQEIAGTHK
jgi:hypothetical protein